MKNFVRIAAAAGCLGLLVASAAHADEIYKWVDKDGKTHYSSRPEDASGAPTTSVRPPPPPAGAGAPPSAREANEEVIRRKSVPGVYDPAQMQPPVAARREVHYYPPESPEGKCIYARKILAGRMVHGNGAPLDAKDLEIARNDVAAYCGKTSK